VTVSSGVRLYLFFIREIIARYCIVEDTGSS
jgi:hypothetical protein